MVSAAFVPRNVHPVDMGNPVLKSGPQNITDTKEAIPMEVDTADDIINWDSEQPTEVEAAVL